MNEPIGYALNCNNCGKTIGYEEGYGDYEDCTFICVECNQEGVFERLRQKRYDERVARDKAIIDQHMRTCSNCGHVHIYAEICNTQEINIINWVNKSTGEINCKTIKESCNCNNYVPRGIL